MGGGGGGGNLGVILVRVCEPVFQNLSHSYTWPSKNGPIHTLDHPKCWPIHILPFDFLYPFLAGYYTNIIVNSCNTKRISSLEKSLNEKYVHIPGCQNNGAFHIGIQKNRVIHILFVEKRGPIIYLAALKKGAIRHAHPYYALYRKLPPPPLTREQEWQTAIPWKSCSGTCSLPIHSILQDRIERCTLCTFTFIFPEGGFPIWNLVHVLEGGEEEEEEEEEAWILNKKGRSLRYFTVKSTVPYKTLIDNPFHRVHLYYSKFM